VPSVTADTNIYVSGLHFGGLPRLFLDEAAAGHFRLDISEPILHETLRVFAAKFDWDDELLHEVERDIRSYTNLTTPAQTLDVIHADPSDNRILECAIAANSDFIVTGDTRHILPLVRYAGIPIVKVAEFLKRLGEINE
jgi:putative PIN family toxin of toxin-antitoxin system